MKTTKIDGTVYSAESLKKNLYQYWYNSAKCDDDMPMSLIEQEFELDKIDSILSDLKEENEDVYYQILETSEESEDEFEVEMSYTFKVTWKVRAKNTDEAMEKAAKHCGCVNPSYQSSLPCDDIDWEGSVHPDDVKFESIDGEPIDNEDSNDY